MSFVLALVMGFGGGYWLDGWWGTRPWLAFVGFFLGLAAGVLNVYRVLQATNSSSSTQEIGPAGKIPRRDEGSREGSWRALRCGFA